jgi:hypothetical protein
MSVSTTAVEPASFRRAPWKNGAGVSVTMAQDLLPGARADGWDDVVWRLSATTILEDGPFSDLAGYDRLQAVTAGSGLTVQTPEGEVDLRTPLAVRRYPGEGPIACALRDGPVDVVNLIGDRALVSLELKLIQPGPAGYIQPGQHVVWAFRDGATVAVGGVASALEAGHILRIETTKPTRIGVSEAACWLASVFAR